MNLEVKPKWIVFDVGGVLLDWKPSMTDVGKELGVTGDTFHSFLLGHLDQLEKGETKTINFWEETTKNFRTTTSPKSLDKLWITSHIPIKEIWKLTEGLENEGYELAILTNNWENVVRQYEKIFPEFPKIEIIVDSSVEHERKPKGRIYRIVEERTGSSGGALFFIDDSKENIETAKKLEWQTYLFQTENAKDSCDELRKILL